MSRQAIRPSSSSRANRRSSAAGMSSRIASADPISSPPAADEKRAAQRGRFHNPGESIFRRAGITPPGVRGMLAAASTQGPVPLVIDHIPADFPGGALQIAGTASDAVSWLGASFTPDERAAIERKRSCSVLPTLSAIRWRPVLAGRLQQPRPLRRCSCLPSSATAPGRWQMPRAPPQVPARARAIGWLRPSPTGSFPATAPPAIRLDSRRLTGCWGWQWWRLRSGRRTVLLISAL